MWKNPHVFDERVSLLRSPKTRRFCRRRSTENDTPMIVCMQAYTFVHDATSVKIFASQAVNKDKEGSWTPCYQVYLWVVGPPRYWRLVHNAEVHLRPLAQA